MAQPDGTLDYHEAATLVGRAVNTVRSWVFEGLLEPAYCLRGKVWFRAADVRAVAARKDADPRAVGGMRRVKLAPPQGLPCLPTTAAPGTREKMAVMADRFERGQPIFHAFDAREPGDPRPVEFMKRRSA